LRLAAVDGLAVPDPEARLPGRGAYLCRTTACLERAKRRGAVARTLRQPVELAPETLAAAAGHEPAERPNHLESLH
jgi:predicted RNA-binding protein YlxR (DUF448 family)